MTLKTKTSIFILLLCLAALMTLLFCTGCNKSTSQGIQQYNQTTQSVVSFKYKTKVYSGNYYVSGNILQTKQEQIGNCYEKIEDNVTRLTSYKNDSFNIEIEDSTVSATIQGKEWNLHGQFIKSKIIVTGKQIGRAHV